MFDSILVPLDRSALAEGVLPHVTMMAHAFNSRVTLMHAIDTPYPAQSSGVVDPLEWQIRRAEAESYLQVIAQRLDQAGVASDKQLAEGDAAEQILEHSNANHSDLIAFSSHGQSGLTGWNVSSVVQKVASRAYTSLMIVRAYQSAPSESSFAYQRVLVPMDGSQRAEYVIPVAARLASQGAQVLLAHIVQRPEMPRRTPLTREDSELSIRYIESNQIEAEQYLYDLHNRLPGDNFETRVVVSDHVNSTLHDLVNHEGIDLVLASAHGYSGQSRWPFGSVVGSFIAYGTTPLLIVQDAQPPFTDAGRSVTTEASTRGVRELQGAFGIGG